LAIVTVTWVLAVCLAESVTTARRDCLPTWAPVGSTLQVYGATVSVQSGSLPRKNSTSATLAPAAVSAVAVAVTFAPAAPIVAGATSFTVGLPGVGGGFPGGGSFLAQATAISLELDPVWPRKSVATALSVAVEPQAASAGIVSVAASAGGVTVASSTLPS